MKIAVMCAALALIMPVAIAHGQNRTRPAKPSAGQAAIRLTSIPNELGGSNCSLYLDPGLTTFVGGWEYGIDEPWHLGISGKRYTLRETQTAPARTVLIGPRGAPRVVISQVDTIRSSANRSIDRVSVVVTLGGRTQTLQAYRSCGEG